MVSLALLTEAGKDAVRWGYLVRNVAEAADRPKGKAAEMRVWSPDQLRAFLGHVAGTTCMPSGRWSP